MGQKAIFLDRDDTLIEDPGYITQPSQVQLLPGVAEAMVELRKMGFLLVVTTNQSAVARGMVTEDGLAQIHHQLEKLLGNEGAYLDRIYYCPYHPNGVVPEYRKDSDLRKPSPGMILKAAQEMQIDLDRSWAVGNSYRDIEAGVRAGCKTILISTSVKPTIVSGSDPTPFQKAVNMKEAVNIIKMYDRQHHVPSSPSREDGGRSSTPLHPPMESSMTTMNSPSVVVQSKLKTETEAASAVAGIVSPERKIIPSDSSKDTTTDKPDTKAHPSNPEGTPKEPIHAGNRTEELLEDILRQLRASRRETLFDDFSFLKVISGLLQILVVFCLLVSLWFLMDQTRHQSGVFLAIQYALVLQLMVVSFYLMRDRK